MNTLITPESRLQGCFYMLLAMLCFSVMNTLIRLIASDIPTTEIVFLRNFLSIFMMLPWVIYEGKRAIQTQRMSGHFWRAALGIISMELWFRSIALMDLAHATALSFTTPIFVTIFAIFFLKEKTDRRRIAAIGVGLMGTLVILSPSASNATLHTSVAVMALVSFAITAVTSILVKTLTRTERSGTIVFYMALFMTPLSAGPAWLEWHELSHYHLLVGVMIAFFSTCGHFLITRAYSNAEMTFIIPIDFTRLIFTSIFAYLLFGEMLNARTCLGAALIVAAAVISATINAREMQRRIVEEVISDVKE